MQHLEPHACAVCGEVLELLAGGPGEPRWLHVDDLVAGQMDHVVVPVPVDQIEAVLRCDFCYSIPRQRWRLRVRPMMVGPSFTDDPWLCCEVCADLITKNRWTTLRQRSEDSYVAEHGETSGMRSMRQLHSLVRKNAIGVPEPMEPSESTAGE